jgi:hypothetical protein
MKTLQNSEIRFYDVFDIILVDIPERSRDIVAKRFGVSQEKPATLQAIGDEYGITRERVRQIVQSGLRCACNANNCNEYIQAQNIIESYIDQKHKVVLFDELERELAGDNYRERGAIRFLIEGMPNVEIINSKKYPVHDNVVALEGFDLDHWLAVHNSTKNLLIQEKKVYTSDVLYKKIVSEHELEHSQHLERYLIISKEIGNNPFNKWGLYDWDEISPRGVREKALLIMQEKKRPMHFREITQAIDEYGLGKNGKKSHPQTVHNELIRDDNFVLVGRGIYTLKDDEYIKGTVKEVIENILKNSKESLSKEEIIERVLQKRYVKPSTVKVNLNAVAKKMNKNID